MKSIIVLFLNNELGEKSILIYINLPNKILEIKILGYVLKINNYTFQFDYKIFSLKAIQRPNYKFNHIKLVKTVYN